MRKRAFKVDGKALRVSNSLLIQNRERRDLYKTLQDPGADAPLKDTMGSIGGKGECDTTATIKKAQIAPLRTAGR